MPSESNLDGVRVVIDEASFDFRGLTSQVLESYLDDFNDTLWVLRQDSVGTYKPPMFEAAVCTDEYDLFDYLGGEPGSVIDRDTRNRFFGLISKCQEWDSSVPLVTDIAIGGATPVLALSIAYAHTRVLCGYGVACLVFEGSSRRGFLLTTSSSGSAKLFFFASASVLLEFWRGLYELEDVPESRFFALAERAFPTLIFNPDLSFRRFDGAYRTLRDRVVTHLSVLNDHFLTAHQDADGLPSAVEPILTAKGCSGVSPESPQTHKSEAKMRQRDVLYNGRTIRCEWHSKVEPHRNRIHFGFGDALGDKVFIGIFVDHLET